MREIQILFKAPMVRAILEGRKTQTRRLVKPQPEAWKCDDGLTRYAGRMPDGTYHDVEADGLGKFRDTCPFGKRGDHLWVRETCRAEELDKGEDGVRYLADNEWRAIENTRTAADAWIVLNRYRGQIGATVPSIHMPRWACRTLLEVTGVRVERLQDISAADAIAEGIRPIGTGFERFHPDPADTEYTGTTKDPVLAYRGLWESIEGPGSWDSNPWLWVIDFKRIEQPAVSESR